jgi:hypothetical protein
MVLAKCCSLNVFKGAPSGDEIAVAIEKRVRRISKKSSIFKITKKIIDAEQLHDFSIDMAFLFILRTLYAKISSLSTNQFELKEQPIIIQDKDFQIALQNDFLFAVEDVDASVLTSTQEAQTRNVFGSTSTKSCPDKTKSPPVTVRRCEIFCLSIFLSFEFTVFWAFTKKESSHKRTQLRRPEANARSS